MTSDGFHLELPFEPTGDQPDAIRALTDGVRRGERWQTLLGVTGSGKTVTMAGVIQETGLPTLVMSHNKTLAAQLYGEPPWWRGQVDLDPILVSRQARPFAVGSPGDQVRNPIAQTQRVFNGAHDYVEQRVEQFAELRGDDGSAFGWRLYLVSQEHYLRFCCWEVIQELVRPPSGRMPAEAGEQEIKDR